MSVIIAVEKPIIRFNGELKKRECNIYNALSGKKINMSGCVLGSSISHEGEPHEKIFLQIKVICSKKNMSHLFGRKKSSLKKMSDERNKIINKKGLKIRLLTGVISENGKPHPIRSGSEARLRNS